MQIDEDSANKGATEENEKKSQTKNIFQHNHTEMMKAIIKRFTPFSALVNAISADNAADGETNLYAVHKSQN